MKRRKSATIKDIAKRLGISHSTVSRALSEHAKSQVHPKTQRLVQETAAEMGYSPNLMARGVVTGKSGTLGLLTYQITAEGYAELTQGLMVEAHKQGYQILFELAVSPDAQGVKLWMRGNNTDIRFYLLQHLSDLSGRIGMELTRGRPKRRAITWPWRITD